MAVTKGFTETDCARFADAARQQLNGPVVPVRDNVNTHVFRAMRELIAKTCPDLSNPRYGRSSGRHWTTEREIPVELQARPASAIRSGRRPDWRG
jgi:hypothetical protein